MLLSLSHATRKPTPTTGLASPFISPPSRLEGKTKYSIFYVSSSAFCISETRHKRERLGRRKSRGTEESYEMGSVATTSPFKDQPHCLARRFLPWTIYAILPLAIFRLYLYPLQLPRSSPDQLSSTTATTVTSFSDLSPPLPTRFSSSQGTYMHSVSLLKPSKY